ncbi:MAG TPA: hypothetical protein VH134_06355 [Candidatus Dormibacteraeota bacterium]|nr:hypothetical protein [Candidatus Dormibacteraeota bacterium]
MARSRAGTAASHSCRSPRTRCGGCDEDWLAAVPARARAVAVAALLDGC